MYREWFLRRGFLVIEWEFCLILPRIQIGCVRMNNSVNKKLFDFYYPQPLQFQDCSKKDLKKIVLFVFDLV